MWQGRSSQGSKRPPPPPPSCDGQTWFGGSMAGMVVIMDMEPLGRRGGRVFAESGWCAVGGRWWWEG
eukprot:COSAG02_NODE_526_length_20707_cov_11.431337_13_plen_67_part_00